MTARPPFTRPRLAVMAALLPAVLLATGCTGDDPQEERTAEEVLAAAQAELDETSGVTLALTTEELPDGVDGVLEATGTATRAPAFDGDLKILFNNLSFDVPVVSVDGTVHAQIPGTTTMSKINPGDYGAPDPANLMDPETGIPTWLTAAEDVETGEETRSGRKVLTEYTGTLPGSAVAAVIPSADDTADFPVTFNVDEDDRLDSAALSGPFYGDGGEVDYTIRITGYDVDEEITAP